MCSRCRLPSDIWGAGLSLATPKGAVWGSCPDSREHVQRGFDELGSVRPRAMFRYRPGDMNTELSLSLRVSVTLRPAIRLLSGALNSVSGELAARCRSHRGDRTPRVAQASGALLVHGEAICIPLGPARLQTQLRFTEPGAGVEGAGGLLRGGPTRPELLLPASGRRGLCPAQRSPVPVPNQAMVSMRAAPSHWDRKFQALGRSALCLPGPAQQLEVPGNVLAKVLPPPVALSRLPHAFRQKDRPCYRSVDLRTQQAPLCAKAPALGGP